MAPLKRSDGRQRSLNRLEDHGRAEKMKVLICWAGARSHRIALVLRDWLPSVIQHVAPWVSSEDIQKGAAWLPELAKQLESSGFGIICLVPENVKEPWIHFEAGALFKSIEKSRLAPFLVGLAPRDLSGPLATFQATRFEKEEVRKLVHSINGFSAKPIPRDRLNQTFDACWPKLEADPSMIAGPQEEPAPELDAVAPVIELPEKQRAILILLGERPDIELVEGTIASIIEENPTRTKYHLEQLRERGLITVVFGADWEETYDLTTAGRAYVVERGLI